MRSWSTKRSPGSSTGTDVAEAVSCEKWFDGTYWTATLPAGWRFFQDRSIDGFPHVFMSAAGSRLQVGVRKDVELNYLEDEVPPELRSEAQRKAYRMTLMDARLDQGWTWRDFAGLLFPLVRRRALTGRQLGALLGFTYDRRTGGWAGYLGAGRWMLYAKLTPAEAAPREDSETALMILASFTFH